MIAPLLFFTAAYGVLYTAALAVAWAQAEWQHRRIKRACVAYNQYLDLMNRTNTAEVRR